MKAGKHLLKVLQQVAAIALMLALQGGCVTIQDTRNRENQIKNNSKTFVEAYMAKRILLNKESTRETYLEIFQLQDSLQQALGDVRTVEGLKLASIQVELKEMRNLKEEISAYIDYPGSNEYTRRFGPALHSADILKGSEELFQMLQGLSPSGQLPGEYREMKNLAKARSTFLFNLQEYLTKRTLTASQGYRNWADVYRQKGFELQEALGKDKGFTMTDLERIQTERIAENYLVLSLRFIEKSDSLLAAGKEAPNPWKGAAEIKLKKHLRLQRMAQN